MSVTPGITESADWTIVCQKRGDLHFEPLRVDDYVSDVGDFPEVHGTWSEMDQRARSLGLSEMYESVWIVKKTDVYVVTDWREIEKSDSRTMHVPTGIVPIWSEDRDYGRI